MLVAQPSPVDNFPAARRRIFLNGKYTAQRTTGVQRVASELVKALDDLLDPTADGWELLCPAGACRPRLRHIGVRHVGLPGLPLHLWEQAVLPLAATGEVLVNLAGGAPWLGRRQICLLHDAAIFDRPEAYAPNFGRWYRALFRRLARSGAQLLTVSEFSRERLAFHLKVDAARITVIPNGADHLDGVQGTDAAAVLQRHALVGQRYLLAVGSANPTKNHAAMMEAYRSMPFDPQHRLVIVGRGDARIFNEASGSGEPSAGVLQLGALEDDELKVLYQHAQALIFPSTYEGFGLPPLEAMRLGCPVAASTAAAVPEVCGRAALYFDPADCGAMAGAMQRLLRDADERARLRVAGFAHAARWSWQDAASLLRLELLSAAESRSLP